MLRALHKFPGLIAALLIIAMTATGAVLSVLPALERAQVIAQTEAGLDVATLAGRVVASYPGVERIKRAPSGQISAFYFVDDRPEAMIIDPATGMGATPYAPSGTVRWLTNLHRSLLLDDAGRLAVAAGAAAMLILSISGLFLLVRRVGGWRKIFSRQRGTLSARLHVEIARVSVAGLLFSSVTALFMVMTTFDVIPDGDTTPDFPANVSGLTGFDVVAMPALRATPVSDLRELSFPYPGDATDVFTLETNQGQGYLDQGNGELLIWADHSALQTLIETIYMLHTGQGLWWLGLILGVMVLGAPVMAITGVMIWLGNRGKQPRLRDNAAAGRADTILLVGSEGGSTWGFAATLHGALVQTGHQVHTAAMSSFDPGRYTHAARIIVLAATYGDGAAPASARGFLDRLRALQSAPAAALVVLGFGDRQFPAFCGFAQDVVQEATAKGWTQLLPMDSIDRQSPQDFARWGRALGAALGHDLVLSHQPKLPRSHALTLVSRRDYGAEVQAPTVILRFARPCGGVFSRLTKGRAMPRYAAGDLLGILPEGSCLPRFYSLASGSEDGFVEICVKKHPGGLCSGQLFDLRPGDVVQGFIRHNLSFRPARGSKPVILIGAGTGIGPLAGFARNNRPGRAMHLYFGARHAGSDLLYDTELKQWHADGRLSTLNTAFSRAESRAYVQDILRRDAAQISALITNGAQILVCGGREMAMGVAAAVAEIVAPMGLNPAILKAKGRYTEDVY